jgi:hypothetical protein
MNNNMSRRSLFSLIPAPLLFWLTRKPNTLEQSIRESILKIIINETYCYANKDFLTVKTSSGKVIFKKDCIDIIGKHPDEVRGMVMPSVSPGYTRKEIWIDVDVSGREVNWLIKDIEARTT